MDFSSIGGLNSYVKTMGMQWKWTQKKESNDFTSKGSATINNWLEEKIAKEKEQAAQMEQEQDTTLSTIRTKILSGKKLTLDERKYLQEKDPQTYQKLVANEMEQKNYEEALKKCKSKDEVERLKMTQMAKSLSAVNSVMHDSAIPESAKLGLMMQELQKVKLIEASTLEFIESGQYGKLPTEAELRKAEKDLKEAEQAEKEAQASENADDSKNADHADDVERSDRDASSQVAEREKVENGSAEIPPEIAARGDNADMKIPSEAIPKTGNEDGKIPPEVISRLEHADAEIPPEAVREGENADAAVSPQAVEEAKKAVVAQNNAAESVALDSVSSGGRSKAEMTRVEAEQTPEAKKVRRAKAAQAYQNNKPEAAGAAIMASIRQVEVNA